MDPRPVLAFDFDGVIFPDVKFDWRKGNLEDLIALRKHLMPIFKPSGNFFIITGRPEEDRGYTEEWLKEYGITPLALFMNPSTMYSDATFMIDAVTHKANTINRLLEDHTIVKYIESDLIQVHEIRARVKIPVVHFMEFVDGKLWE